MSPLILRWLEADRKRRAHSAFLVEKLLDGERDILMMLCNGHQSPQIAAAIGTNQKHVENKYMRIKRVLGVSSLAEAGVVAEQGGLL